MIFAAEMLLGGCGRLRFERHSAADASVSDAAMLSDAAFDATFSDASVSDAAMLSDAAFDATLSDGALADASSDGALADASSDGALADAALPDASGTDASVDASLAEDGGGGVTLTVRVTGAGFGDVFLNNIAMECGRSCTRDLARGAAVNLTARADDTSWFRGWAAGPCSGRAGCEFVMDGDVTVDVDFTPRPNRIFVTSEEYEGALGGLSGADAICQAHADAASLGGTFLAVLSTSSTSWVSRFSSNRGWIRVDGQPVFDTMSSTTRMLGHVAVDENGAQQRFESMWLPHFGGTSGCLDYTSSSNTNTARADLTTRAVNWGSGGESAPCDSEHLLICAENRVNQPVEPVATHGRGAFASNGTWTVSTGRDTADALCASEALAAGRSGSYLALLALAGERPLDRFDTSGPPWVRSDGLAFLPTAAAWLTSEYYDVAPSLTATGTSLGYSFVFEGAPGPNGVGPVSNCDNWTRSSGTSLNSFCGRTWWTSANCDDEASGVSCMANVRVFCLEE